MKKPGTWILVLITCVFSAFVFGFFLGRNMNRAPVQIQQLTAATDAIQMEALPDNSTENTDISESAETENVPTGDTAEATESTTAENETTAPASSGLIDINTATAAQLETLPGIGNVIAQRIVDYRNAHGPFKSVSELTKVEGIGKKRLAAIWDLVTIGG